MATIRKARIRDIDSIIEMLTEFSRTQRDILQRSFPAHVADMDEKDDVEVLRRSFIRKQIYSKNGLILQAEENGVSAGFLFATIHKNMPIFIVEWIGEITLLFVREEFQRSGIATSMKKQALAWLKAKGVSRVKLIVLPDNHKAIPVYEKWGFEPFVSEMRMDVT